MCFPCRLRLYAVFLWVYPVTALWENRERGQSDAFYRNSFEMTVKKCYLPTSDVTAVSYSSLRRFFFFLFVLWETCLCRSTDLLEARVGTSQGPLHANWSALRRDSLKISSRKHTRMLSLCLSNGSPSIISGLQVLRDIKMKDWQLQIPQFAVFFNFFIIYQLIWISIHLWIWIHKNTLCKHTGKWTSCQKKKN